MLQEVVAGWLELGVGSYNHLSDSLHVYERDFGHLEQETRVKEFLNTDTLALPKQQSEECISTLAQNVEQIIDPRVDSDTLLRNALNSQLTEVLVRKTYPEGL